MFIFVLHKLIKPFLILFFILHFFFSFLIVLHSDEVWVLVLHEVVNSLKGFLRIKGALRGQWWIAYQIYHFLILFGRVIVYFLLYLKNLFSVICILVNFLLFIRHFHFIFIWQVLMKWFFRIQICFWYRLHRVLELANYFFHPFLPYFFA